MDGLITYEGTHTVGRRAPRELAEEVAACLARFGYAAEPSDAAVLLEVRGDGEDLALAHAQAALATEYGAYPQRRTTRGPDGREWGLYRWPVDPPALDPAMTRVAALRAEGGIVAERLRLKLQWKCRLRDPDTRELLPGQDALPRLDNFPGGRADASTAALTLGPPTALDLWLLFPWAEPDEGFRAYVRRLQGELPVALSARGWRRWRRTRAGTWKAARLDPAPGTA